MQIARRARSTSTRRSVRRARNWRISNSREGKTREGIEQLEALAALEPSRPQRLVNVGLAYARAESSDAAITTLGRAADRYPEADVVYVALGRVWLASAEGLTATASH